MATTKKMTEVQLLAAAREFLNSLTPEEFAERCPETAETWTLEETAAKVEHMHETRSKKREKDPNAPKTKTKTRLENEKLAVQAAEAIADHPDGVGSRWVMEHVPYITSTQRVTSVMRVATELGLINSSKDEKGKALYLPIV